MVKAFVGMRVHIFSPNRTDDWGFGTITKVEPLLLEDDVTGEQQVLCADYPSEITMDDGRKTEGMECWWHPITEQEHE